MKGIIFTEFIEMVESKFGLEVMDEVLNKSNLASGGVYTSIGTYDHAEMVELVSHLSAITKIEVVQLLEVFGEYLFTIFVKSYPHFFEGIGDSFSFLEQIEAYIHPEVLKIYPEAELPHFNISRQGNTLHMVYKSKRKMAPFAYGLIKGCLNHFNEPAQVDMKPLAEDGSIVEFTISK